MANFNPTYYQQITSNTNSGIPVANSSYILARVVHIVQGPTLVGTDIPDLYYKNPTSLGTITFELLTSGQTDTFEADGNNTAIPINSAFKHYPLPSEIVYIIPGPSLGMNESANRRQFYYSTPYNIWGASHHNAFPNLKDYDGYVNEDNRLYQESVATNQPNNLSVTGSAPYPLGPNFPEKAFIRSLRQFTGDITIEGRWGNSIRFGSTTAINGYENNWSRSGEAGSPITIIRNGQSKNPNSSISGSSPLSNIDDAWLPTVEDPNRDASSIYLTQGQEIIIDDINNNFSLASLETVFARTYTLSIPIQQQLTSFVTTSPREQDEFIANTAGNEPQKSSQPPTIQVTG